LRKLAVTKQGRAELQRRAAKQRAAKPPPKHGKGKKGYRFPTTAEQLHAELKEKQKQKAVVRLQALARGRSTRAILKVTRGEVQVAGTDDYVAKRQPRTQEEDRAFWKAQNAERLARGRRPR
jgi:hypothetical protein